MMKSANLKEILAVLCAGLACAAWQGFAAPAANIDQIRNGSYTAPIDPPNWVNGNAGFENAHYFEGHSIAYRALLTGLPSGSTITLRIGYDVRNSGANALDYLTGFQNLDPHNFGTHNVAETVNPTIGTVFQESVPAADDTTPILPPDVNIQVNGVPQPTTSFNALAAAKVMSIWGASFVGAKFAYQAGQATSLTDNQSEEVVEVTFSPTGATALLSWGGHIASRKDWGYVNGVPDSAGGINGSPYHMRLKDWIINGQLISLGNQDRSLKANAVIVPPSCTVSSDSECAGGTASLTVTPVTEFGGFGGPYTMAWSRTINGDGTLGTIISTDPTLTINNVQAADAGTYYAMVKDSKGVTSPACSGTLTVNAAPVASAGPDQTVCEDAAGGYTFTVNGTAANGSPAWTVVSKSPSDLGVSFGSPDSASTSVTFSKAGTATILLTVTSTANPSCGQATDTAILTVNPNPVASAGPDLTACADVPGPGHTFNVSGTAQNGTAAWTVVPGSLNPADLGVTFGSPGSAVTTVALSKPGTATVRLTVTSNADPSCGQASDDTVLTVNPNPVASAGPDQTVCEDVPGPGHTFNVVGTVQNGMPAWEVTGKSPSDLVVTLGSPSATSTTVSFNKAGSAIVQLAVTSTATPSCGQATDSATLTVNPNPVASAGPDVAACDDVPGPGHTFNVSGTAQNGNPAWTVVSTDPSDLVVTFGTPNSASTTVKLSKPGTATVQLAVTSTATPACAQATDTAVLTVNDVVLAALGTKVVCTGNSVTFNASPSSTAGSAQSIGFAWSYNKQGDSTQTAFVSGTGGATIVSSASAGTSSLTLQTGPGGFDLTGVYDITVLASDSTTGCAAEALGVLTVAKPDIACGATCSTDVLVMHPLDGDTAGGAAVVNDAAIASETFPTGTDISYEPFDKYALLGIAPGQVTVSSFEIPVCNTGQVPITVSGVTSEALGSCPTDSTCSVQVECVEVYCRTTGGGRQDPGSTTFLQAKSGNTLEPDASVRFATHGGQLRGLQTCPTLAASINAAAGSPNICGQWQHVRHGLNNRKQSFHTSSFDSLICGCLGCQGSTPQMVDGVCNPGDRVCGPEPRKANANAMAVTGVGTMAVTPGKKVNDVVFRIYVEDRGEPGGSPFGHPSDPPDVYAIQIWIVNPLQSAALRAQISCQLGINVPAGAPVPDIADYGDLSRGNHQLHPVKNLNCP